MNKLTPLESLLFALIFYDELTPYQMGRLVSLARMMYKDDIGTEAPDPDAGVAVKQAKEYAAYLSE